MKPEEYFHYKARKMKIIHFQVINFVAQHIFELVGYYLLSNKYYLYFYGIQIHRNLVKTLYKFALEL